MRLIPQTTVGIEIAGQDLRLAVVRQFAGRRRLVRLDVLTGFVDLSEDDRISSLAAHFKRHRLSTLNVFLTVPGAWGVTRDLEFPAAVGTGDALRSAAALQVENLSPWGLDEIYWDCAWEPLAAKNARSIVVHVGIVPRSVLDPWIALFRSTRLALTGAALSSLSWAHGVTVLWGAEQPAMVLASEPGHVEGALIHDGRIYSASSSGAEPAELLPASASRLIRAGRLESVDQVRLIPYGAAAAGSGLEFAPLPVEGTTGATTAFGAISTALLGLVRSSFRLNLIPAEFRHQSNHFQFVPTYALVTALVVLAVFAWIREPYQQSVYAGRLDAEAQRLAIEVRPVADQEARLNRVAERMKALDGSLRNRDLNLEALRELSRLLPPGTFLTSYICQDNLVTITGFSDSAASIQKVLEDSPVFRDAQFTSSITRDASGKDRFIVRASIEARP